MTNTEHLSDSWGEHASFIKRVYLNKRHFVCKTSSGDVLSPLGYRASSLIFCDITGCSERVPIQCNNNQISSSSNDGNSVSRKLKPLLSQLKGNTHTRLPRLSSLLVRCFLHTNSTAISCFVTSPPPRQPRTTDSLTSTLHTSVRESTLRKRRRKSRPLPDWWRNPNHSNHVKHLGSVTNASNISEKNSSYTAVKINVKLLQIWHIP